MTASGARGGVGEYHATAQGMAPAKVVATETFHCDGLSLRTGNAVVWDG